MDRYVEKVHDLLHHYADDQGGGAQLPRPPYSRPFDPTRSTSNYFRPARPAVTPSYQQQETIRTPRQDFYQASESVETSLYDDHTAHVLDDYDRALLAEPQSQLPWKYSNGTGSITPGRISLPGHTAPYTPAPHVEGGAIQRERKIIGSASQDFKSKLAAFVHTPPIQTKTSSSPATLSSSSPLFNASQRQPIRTKKSNLFGGDRNAQLKGSQLTTTPNTKKTRTYGVTRIDANERSHGNDIPSSSSPSRPSATRTQINLDHAPPVIQGIQLVSTNELPDRFQSVFPFNPFNAVQSKCFPTAYHSDKNLVVSAPTGGGKTAIFELAICHLISGLQNNQYKIVYMAPTKSLCSERQRDWQAKFATLDLVCAELTGDTDFAHIRSVQSANIIITTPEKFDSMTRQWKDHAKLIQLVKLFLIDEVHMLRDNRGATLEAVISRVKSVGTKVRFVALSATVPNSDDVAVWLGESHARQDQPAVREVFGEEFRPVKLQKHVVGLQYKGNDFGFEGICNSKLPSIIAKYGKRKPLMIFCITRNSAQSTAKLLANMWASKDPKDRHWNGPTQRITVDDPELASALSSAVAFHHAGLRSEDRQAIETGFLTGQISIICCTSTLAVGVNLPCHLVIIKNTVSYQGDSLKEYAELEITQMLGRAGRPQFDDSAVAVIVTKQEKVKKYEQLVSGGEILESCLHLNLIDHLNAEIGLGTVNDLESAKIWLAGTFLYVRLRKNPEHYSLDGDNPNAYLDQRIEGICQRDLELLNNADLISLTPSIQATELGLIMARYYVQFKTMQTLLKLGSRSPMSAILSALVQAQEYHEIRLRSFEKKLFKEINGSNGIKFPIKVDLAMHEHKRSLLIQSELGGIEFPMDEQYAKHRRTFVTEKSLMFLNVHRLIRCVIDVQVYLQDAVGARNALELARSLSAGVWDNSPFQMKQIPNIGPVAIRKLALAGITSIESLESTEPHRIEVLLSRNPPFGSKLLSQLRDFPKLRVSVKNMNKESKKGPTVSIKLKLECGFINEKAPLYFNRKPVYVCLLTERSDGHLVDFRRISAKKLDNGQDVLITAVMLSHTQYVTCYVMCEDVAGTMQYAELKPGLPAPLFTAPPPVPLPHEQMRPASARSAKTADDEFGADEIDDQDLVNVVESQDFQDIDNVLPSENPNSIRQGLQRNFNAEPATWSAEKLENGKWACNHKCKDKAVCKHLCCREGLDKPPKAPKASFVPASTLVNVSDLPQSRPMTQLKLDMSPSTKMSPSGRTNAIEKINLTNEDGRSSSAKRTPRQMQVLDKLHQNVSKRASVPTITQKKPSLDFSSDYQPRLSFLTDENGINPTPRGSTDYGDNWTTEFPSPSVLLNQASGDVSKMPYYGSSGVQAIDSARDNTTFDTNSLEDFDLSQFDNDEWDTEAALIGLSDSITMQEESSAEQKALTISASKDPPRPNHATPKIPTRNYEHDIAPPSISDKRPAGNREVFSENENLNQENNNPKRQKLTQSKQEQKTQTVSPIQQPLLTSNKNRQASSPPPVVPVIKPGQPAWVYELDPAFVAEYQDIVDFV